MPRIPDQIKDCVFYVYPSLREAEAGARAGGSGFFVGLRSAASAEQYFVYAVTNSHVVRGCGQADPVLRLNTTSGGLGFVTTRLDQWRFHQDGDDLAAIGLVVLPPQFRDRFIGEDLFLTKDLIREHDIGPGDDVFIVGRYVDHDGKQRNLVSVRFGNLSVMNEEPVIQEESGIRQESFLVECRSLGGYSGAPVFVWIPPLASRPQSDTLQARQFGPWLLGIDWGHLQVEEVVRDEGGKEHPERWKVRSSSGMAAVVPVWKMVELLNQPEFATDRLRREEILRRSVEGAAHLGSTE